MCRARHAVPLFALLLAASPALAADPPAPAPRTYAVPCAPSALLRRHAELLALAAAVRGDLAAMPAADDAATTRRRWTTLFQVAVLERDTAAAHAALERVRETQDAPAQKAMAGLFTEPLVDARAAAPGDFHAAYRERLRRRLASVPYADVEFVLQAVGGQMRSASPDTALGTARAVLDPLLENGRIGGDAAATLIALAVNDELVRDARADVLACLDATFAAHRNDAEVFAPPIGVVRPHVRGAWLGQKPPGRTPVRFAPAVLDSVNRWCNGIAFSPDGHECLLSVGGPTYGGSLIVRATYDAGAWSAFAPMPALAEFVTTLEPHYSADGATLWFTGREKGAFRRLYAVKRTGSAWSAPVPEPGPIEGDGDAYRGCCTRDGTWYFGLQLDGMMQIRRATPVRDGGYRIELLGAPVNQRTFDGDPCVAPDGRWLVFNSARNASTGGADLFVSFADGHGGWGTPIRFGPAFNTADDEFGAMLSPDGRHLFFTRHTASGSGVLVVDAAVVDEMRPSGRR